MQQRFLPTLLRSALTEFCWLNLLFCFAVIVSVKQSCSWKSLFPSVCLFLLRFLLLRQYRSSFISLQGEWRLIFTSPHPNSNFFLRHRSGLLVFFCLVFPPRFYPSCALRRWRWLVFWGASLSIPMTALLFGVNEKEEKNKQENNNKMSESRGAENQLSWTSRPAPGEGKHCVLTELPNYFGGKTRRTGTHMLQFRGY